MLNKLGSLAVQLAETQGAHVTALASEQNEAFAMPNDTDSIYVPPHHPAKSASGSYCQKKNPNVLFRYADS